MMFAVFLVSLATVPRAIASDALWNSYNCDEGDVMDAVCCMDSHCSGFESKRACEIEKTCLWSGNDKACKSNRDSENNVCCRSPKKSDVCDSAARGECPEDFQVPKGCCKDTNVRTFLDVKNVSLFGFYDVDGHAVSSIIDIFIDFRLTSCAATHRA